MDNKKLLGPRFERFRDDQATRDMVSEALLPLIAPLLEKAYWAGYIDAADTYGVRKDDGAS